MADNDRIPIIQRIAFGTGHILNIMSVVGMWYPYSVTFFHKVRGLSSPGTATILLISQVAGAIVTPFIGIWSDFCLCKYGRRKIFHLVGIICAACSFFFIWFRCIDCENLPESYHILYYSSFAVVFQFGWACTQISQLALVPELTSDKATKVELNSIRYGVQVVSAMFVFVLMWTLLDTVDSGLVDAQHFGPHTQTAFWILALVVTVVGFVLTLPFQIFIREKYNVRVKKLKWYRWLKNPQFYLAIGAFIVSKLVTVMPLTYIPLYFLETLQMNKTSIAIGPLVLFVVSCIITPFVKWVNKWIEIKLLYTVGILIVLVAMTWFWLDRSAKDPSAIFDFERDDIYLAVVLYGVGGSVVSIMGLTFLSNVVGEYTGSSAFVYGWAFFGDRLSNGIVNNIILRVNYEDEKSYYRYVIVYVTLASSIMGLFAVVAMKLTELLWPKKDEGDQLPEETQYGTIQNDAASGSYLTLQKSTEIDNSGSQKQEEEERGTSTRTTDVS